MWDSHAQIDQDDCSEHDEYFQFTGRARLSRDMHILEGYIQGIAADSKILDAELKQLIRWLSEHKEFANRHPFCEVIPRIQKIISKGIADEGERADILWLSNKFTTNDEYYDDLTSDLQRLQGMLAGILSDGRITEEELVTLDRWISERSHLRHCWPYDHLAGIVELVMRDGRIDAQEHEALLQLFGEFVQDTERRAVGALEPGVTVSGVCCMSPCITFGARCFCFTGKSKRATKDQLKEIVVQLGGSFHKEVRNDTNYLIVGAVGNPCWAFACYGRKIEDAVSRRRDGQDISVVQEIDFWQAVEKNPSGVARIEDAKSANRNVNHPSPPNDSSEFQSNALVGRKAIN